MRGASDVFVARVGATADESVADPGVVPVLFGVCAELGERAREIGGMGTDDPGFESRQIDLDHAVIELSQGSASTSGSGTQ